MKDAGNASGAMDGAIVSYSVDDFGQMMRDALRALEPQQSSPDENPDVSELVGEGTGLDGMIRVTAQPGGRLDSVEINSRAMRADSQTLAEQLMIAANAALQEVQEKIRARTAAAAPDVATLAGHLREIQNSALPRMTSFLRAVEDLRGQAGTGR